MDGEHDPRRPLHAAHLAHVWPQLRGERHESVRVSPHESIAARPECSGLLCRRQATPDGGASRLPRRRRASDGESDRSGGQRRRTPLCAPPAARRAGRVDHRPRHPPLGPLLSLSGARVSPSRGGWCRSEMAMVGQRFRRGILGGRSLEGHRDDAAHLTVGARCLSARSGAGAMAWRRRREGAVLCRRRPRRHRRDLRAQPLGPAHGPRRLRSRSPSGLGRL